MRCNSKIFFETLPELPTTTKNKADIAWFLYDIVYNETEKLYHMQLIDTVYTEFQAALQRVIYTKPGDVGDFVSYLQERFGERTSNAPETHSVFELL